MENSLPTGVTIVVDADASGWTGLKPTDTAAFADRKLAAGASHSADLVFATTRSRMPFTLTFRSEASAELGSVNIDRDYLKETCTSVMQGKYTDNDGQKQQVKFTLSCSSTTGATTGTLSQTAVACS